MEKIIQRFIDKGVVKSIVPFGSGHINDTYRVINVDRDASDFLLQRINHKIFTNVPQLMTNMVEVTQHISKKIEADQVLLNSFDTLTIIPAKSGELFVVDGLGNHWRVFKFLKSYHSYDYVETPSQAYQGARAFGLFINLLDDFPMDRVKETIPDFHNILNRLQLLEVAIKNGVAERVLECAEDIKYIYDVSEQMCTIEKLRIEGTIPGRVTHNDTKFNNVLLSADHTKSCVIDLDTVMPGVVHYDFGDGVRTSTSTCVEDEADLSLVGFDMEKFEAFATGFLEMTDDILQPAEIEHLGLSVPLLPYIMGVRFLTDYLLGDNYFKIDFENHNLQRARCQFEFTRKILERLKDINGYVRSSSCKTNTI